MLTVLARRGADAIIGLPNGEGLRLSVWQVDDDRDEEFWAGFATPLVIRDGDQLPSPEAHLRQRLYRWGDAQLTFQGFFAETHEGGRHSGYWLYRGEGYHAPRCATVPVTLLARRGPDMLLGVNGITACASAADTYYELDEALIDTPTVYALGQRPGPIFTTEPTLMPEYWPTSADIAITEMMPVTTTIRRAVQHDWPFPVHVIWDGLHWHVWRTASARPERDAALHRDLVAREQRRRGEDDAFTSVADVERMRDEVEAQRQRLLVNQRQRHIDSRREREHAQSRGTTPDAD